MADSDGGKNEEKSFLPSLYEINPDAEFVSRNNRQEGSKEKKKLDKILADTSSTKLGIIMCELYKNSAFALFQMKRFELSLHEYTNGAAALLGREREGVNSKHKINILSLSEEQKGMYTKICQSTDSVRTQFFVELVSCFKNAAMCFWFLDDRVQVSLVYKFLYNFVELHSHFSTICLLVYRFTAGDSKDGHTTRPAFGSGRSSVL